MLAGGACDKNVCKSVLHQAECAMPLSVDMHFSLNLLNRVLPEVLNQGG